MDTRPANASTRATRGKNFLAIMVHFWRFRWVKILLAAGALIFLAVLCVSVHFYLQFSRIIEDRFAGNIFDNPSVILASPTEVQVGEHLSAEAVTAHLRKAWYSEGRNDQGVGSYVETGGGLEIRPGPESFFSNAQMFEAPARLEFSGGVLVSITALDDMTSRQRYLLEPEEISTLFGQSRTKRHLVREQDLPKVLVDAILATEDHRFYSHHGVDFFRIVGAVIADVRSNERLQGGSTLTMQLARNLFLTPKRTIRRKIAEAFFALLLELRLPKEQILELYANQVYLGQRNSFSIYGFGEAAVAYFNKNVSALTLPEAALLAGMIRGPNLYLPYEHPERAAERRNLVLRRMVETGFLSSADAGKASISPLGLTAQQAEAPQAAYFVDMVKAQMLTQFSEHDLLSQGYRIYTTLNPDLQQAATEGARAALIEVDRQVKQHRVSASKAALDPAQPQIALLALDPHTGDVKALVGGRNYAASPWNRVLARRQPGSAFKPFVYAAALNSAVDGSDPLITLATMLKDEPTGFDFGNKTYAPRNYHQSYSGSVTLRQALSHSLNIPSVRLAEMVGYRKVRDFAVAAGFNQALKATPSIALGSYVATPFELAGAYTIFANHGEYVAPRCVVAVTDGAGSTVWNNPTSPRRVLDPRVSYLTVSLLESVINSGTGAGVRTRGFTLPAAGKTGTSRDGWFAGFTPNLLAVTWVGYDDYRDLKIPAARSALPLWTEFMNRAAHLPAYHDPQPFNPPPGIVTAAIDNLTGFVASAGLETSLTHSEMFIEGTEPFQPQPPEPAISAPASPGQDEAALDDRGPAVEVEEIVLVNEANGHKIYMNNGDPFASSSSRGLRPLGAAQPARPAPPDGAKAATAMHGETGLRDDGTTGPK